MWQYESGVIDMLSLAPEDIVLPLIHVKEILRKAIDDSKLSKELLIPSEQAERIPYIVDQILAHSHAAAAASLSRGMQRVGTARDLLSTRLPGLHNPGTSVQELYAQNSEAGFTTEGTSQENHCLNRLWTMQSFWKETLWGMVKTEIYLVGDRLHSETLYFRVCFSPNPQLSNTGLIIDYTSHHIMSLVHSDCQPAQPDRQPWNISEAIEFAPRLHFIIIVVKDLESLLQSAEELLSRLQGFIQLESHHFKPLDRSGCKQQFRMCQVLSKMRESIDAMPQSLNVISLACEDYLQSPPNQPQLVSDTREIIEVNHRPVEILTEKVRITIQEIAVSCDLLAGPQLRSRQYMSDSSSING